MVVKDLSNSFHPYPKNGLKMEENKAIKNIRKHKKKRKHKKTKKENN